MTPAEVPDALVEKAARVMNVRAGGWEGDWAEFAPEARHALAAVLPEIQAQALRELDREYDRLAARPDLSAIAVRREALLDGFELAMLFLDRRAARLTATTEVRCNCGFGGFHDDGNPRCDQNATTTEEPK